MTHRENSMKKSYAGEIIVGIIVTVVGGLILAWLDGRFADSPTQNEVTLPIPTQSNNIESTSPGTNVSAEVIDESPPTPQGIRNPTSPVEMGEFILVDDYSLMVEDYYVRHDALHFTIMVKNLDAADHLFRYQRTSISVEDDLGNVYEPNYSFLATELYEDVQVEIEAGKVVSFNSTISGSAGSSVIARYLGVVPAQASTLFVKFNGFGPYNGIIVEIEL